MAATHRTRRSRTASLCAPAENNRSIHWKTMVFLARALVVTAVAAAAAVATVATVAMVTVTDLTRRLGCRMALFGIASTKAVYLTSPWRRLHRIPRSIHSRRCRPRRIAKLVHDYDGTAEQEEPLHPLLPSPFARAHCGQNKQNLRKKQEKKSTAGSRSSFLYDSFLSLPAFVFLPSSFLMYHGNEQRQTAVPRSPSLFSLYSVRTRC